MRMRYDMGPGERVVIVGDGETAELAYEYLTQDSPHEVVAFAVERAFHKKTALFDLPVVVFEDLEAHYPPSIYRLFVAISYTQLNRLRARLYREATARGYRCVSYVSSRAFVWRNVQIGANCFILENNVLQYAVSVGDNVVLWSGNHVGHQTKIRDHVFVSSQVVISGYCDIGESCFFGVNSAVANNVTVAKDCVLGIGAIINRDTEQGRIYAGGWAKPAAVGSLEKFGVPCE
jgi:sugar O-acyltransferase (sialic acid O-acetyltransferase NeuD family)